MVAYATIFYPPRSFKISHFGGIKPRLVTLFSRWKLKLRSRSGRWRLGCHLRKQIILLLLSEKASTSTTNFCLLLAKLRSIRICTGSRLRKRGGGCPGCIAGGWLLAARQPNVKNGRGCKKFYEEGSCQKEIMNYSSKTYSVLHHKSLFSIKSKCCQQQCKKKANMFHKQKYLMALGKGIALLILCQA